MIALRFAASRSPLLVAFALGAALVLAPGCGGSDDPARYAGTIDLPKRAVSRFDAKQLAKGKTLAPAGRR